jgi:hypothetical protein
MTKSPHDRVTVTELKAAVGQFRPLMGDLSLIACTSQTEVTYPLEMSADRTETDESL